MASIKRFYLLGSIYGLVWVLIMTWVVLGAEAPMLLDNLSFVFPMLTGVLIVTFLGHLFDQKKWAQNPTLWRFVFITILIFISGALAGALLNFLLAVYDHWADPSGAMWEIFSIAEGFFDYFLKPSIWLVLLGVPSAAGVGISYFFLSQKFLK